MLSTLAVATWATSSRSWLDLRAAADVPGGDVGRLAELLTLLPESPWNESMVRQAAAGPADSRFLHACSRFADGLPPWFEGVITVDQLTHHRADEEWTLEQVELYYSIDDADEKPLSIAGLWHRTLSPYAESMGLTLPSADEVRAYFADSHQGYRERDYDLPNEIVEEYLTEVEKPFSVTDLVGWFQEDEGYQPYRRTQAVQPLVAPTQTLSVELADNLSPADRMALSPAMERDDDQILTEVSVMHVAAVASFFEQSIEEAMTRLRRIRKQVPFTLPRLPARVDRAMKPSKDDLLLLSAGADGLHPWLDRSPSPLHLAKVAARARKPLSAILARATALHPLHPPLPAFSAEVLKTTMSTHPEPKDLLVLSADLLIDGEPVLGTVSPLHVVKASSLLTETCAEVMERLERYAVLGLRTPPRSPGGWLEQVASWQDITVLTQDGRGVTALPAGPVPGEHIRKAATTIDESTAQVVERLHVYASLFGFLSYG